MDSIESFSKLIFSSNGVNSCEIVDGLMKMHANECLWGDGMIGPAKIPVGFLGLIYNFESDLECNFPDDRIVGN